MVHYQWVVLERSMAYGILVDVTDGTSVSLLFSKSLNEPKSDPVARCSGFIGPTELADRSVLLVILSEREATEGLFNPTALTRL